MRFMQAAPCKCRAANVRGTRKKLIICYITQNDTVPSARVRMNTLPRPSEVLVTKFLRDALTADALGVPKLEAMARAAGLLGEGQRITHAKVFKRAKESLGIKSVRSGFGTGGGWLWKLLSDRDGASAASSITGQPARKERRVPADWIEGVARLQYQRPLTDVPHHRWRQFIDDCTKFLNPSGPSAPRS
jgi:hypothetical protein